MPKDLVKRIGEALDRRNFLSHSAAVLASFAAGLLGIAPSANATIQVGCCCLCRGQTPQTYNNCASEWCWTCRNGCAWWICYECYEAPCDTAVCVKQPAGDNGASINNDDCLPPGQDLCTRVKSSKCVYWKPAYGQGCGGSGEK